MSKLTIVRQALKARSDIVIVHVVEATYLPNPNGYWSHTMDFFVGLIQPEFRGDKLQQIMEGLVPDPEPTMMDRFLQYNNGDMAFGKLYFDEEIGTSVTEGTRVLTLTDPDMLGVDGFVDGVHRINLGNWSQIRRRTWVRLYPSEIIARGAAEDGGNYSRISWKEINRLHPKRAS